MDDVKQLHLHISLLSFRDELRAGLNEYSLLKKLSEAPFHLFNPQCLKDSLMMYQTHFILFHGLYLLRDEWLLNQTGILEIHTTCIRLLPFSQGKRDITQNDPLRAFYLNWENMHGVEQEDVDALIDSFWRRMAGEKLDHSEGEIRRARQVLALPETGTLESEMIKRQYRKLMHQCHPDKGGDVDLAQRISWAYNLLST